MLKRKSIHVSRIIKNSKDKNKNNDVKQLYKLLKNAT